MIANSRLELLALHRVIMEAKFAGDLSDTSIGTSPLVATIAERTIESLARIDSDGKWLEWQKGDPGRKEWEISQSRIDLREWPELEHDQKVRIARIAISPLTLTDELIERYVAELDEASRG